jgi:hypothetical protein
MSALLEYECQVPVDGYEVITFEEPEPEEPDSEDEADASTLVIVAKRRMLQPRSERTRRFDLFEVSSRAFLEFAQTPDTLEGIKDLAERYGPLFPDEGATTQFGRDVFWWSRSIREMRRTVELWETSKKTGDFSKILRVVQKKYVHPADWEPGVAVNLRLKEDPQSSSARLCIRPYSLLHAFWAQLLMAIDRKENLGACVQCRKWFTLEAGGGRSDKEYCSNACRMRAYRKRKVSG